MNAITTTMASLTAIAVVDTIWGAGVCESIALGTLVLFILWHAVMATINKFTTKDK